MAMAVTRRLCAPALRKSSPMVWRLVRGHQVWDGSGIVAEPGRSRFVARQEAVLF